MQRRRLLAQLAVGVVVSSTLFCVVSSLPVEPETVGKDLEEFIIKEIEKQDGMARRSGVEELVSDASTNIGQVVEPQRKPEKISVTIFKEYKVKQSNGEYLTVQEEDGGGLNPPQVQSFIEQEMGESSPAEVRVEAPTIHVEREQQAYQLEEVPSSSSISVNQDKSTQFERIPGMILGSEFQRVPSVSYFQDDSPSQTQKPVIAYESQLNFQRANSVPVEVIPTPATTLNLAPASPSNERYFVPKRKTMDGWLPLYGQRSLVRGTVTDLYHRPQNNLQKGTYSPAKLLKNQNSLDTAGSNTVSHVIPFIQVAAAQMMVPRAHQTITQQLQQHILAQPQTLIPQILPFVSQAQNAGGNQGQRDAVAAYSENIIQPAQLLFAQNQNAVPQAQRIIPQPQIIPIVQSKLQFFTQNDVIPAGPGQAAQPIFQNVAPQGSQSLLPAFSQQTQDLFIENKDAKKGQIPRNVVIHAQNVIIGEGNGSEDRRAYPTASTSQIQSYGSTPQITAQLRQQLLLSKAPSHPLSGQAFPPGGLPLRSLAQALRNGAFSPDNNVVPSSNARKEKSIMEITIPHTFKIKNPSGQLTSASINQPIAHGGGGYGGGGYGGGPPKLSNHNKGQSDYGDSVKYQTPGELGLDQIDIVDTQPAGEGGYNNNNNNNNNNGGEVSLSHEAQDLKQRLVQMVLKELASQYGAPGQAPGKPLDQYGPPSHNAPGSGYGVPSGQYGAPGGGNHGPSNEYGAPGHDRPSSEYGSPSGPSAQYGAPSEEYGAPEGGIKVETSEHYNNHHLSPPAIPTTLALDFDIGSGSFPKGHGGGWGSGDDVSIVDAHSHPDGPSTKDQLAKLGSNLFWAAIDFSRKYNPITFYEKVKEFPPIRFEVHDDHHGKGHKRKDQKRRSQKE